MTRKKLQKEEVSLSSITPTSATLEAEMEKLGESFTRVSFPTAEVIAESTELLEGRADVADLARREFPVSLAHFERIVLFLEMIKAFEVRQSIALENRKAQTAIDDEARSKLLDIRADFARLGDAAGLSTDLFSVDTSRQDELYRGMGEVIGIVREHRAMLSDKTRVDALLREADALMATGAEARKKAATLTDARRIATMKIDQAKRLLVDTMRFVSKQGLAAYPNDVNRERTYRLDRLTPKKPAKKNEDPPPTPNDPPTEGVAA